MAIDVLRKLLHALVTFQKATCGSRMMGRVSIARFLGATFAGMVTLAVVGGFIYGFAFSTFIKANLGSATGVMKPPGFLWVGLAHVPFGVLLTLLVLWRGDCSARGGAVTGAILGFLMAASYDLSQYGTTNLWSLRLTLIDPLFSMVMVGVAGSVVGMVLGRNREDSRNG
jgi:hypothetical protein